MNNRFRAAQVIADKILVSLFNKSSHSPQSLGDDIADTLDESGLLAPELPEPHREVALHTPEWFLDGPISLVVSDPSEGVVSYGSDVHNGAFRLVLTKEEAEGIALALLAATNHTQEEACPR